ncbi:helix-turn-helix transcriptional regulator [Burkholderia anthina]|jgi:predicted transcriptional regulator YheO|uniref:helix-turn-helix transcriptional regulator n=1 Tax=Burkholderia anthina TaxID=179879 RepID=UPI0015889FB3|nr:PAS domain-containing protein [Burkholderia anthina]
MATTSTEVTVAKSKLRGKAVEVSASIRAERKAVISAMETVVAVLKSMLGPNVEVVLHDLTRPESSILAITNGHVSGRTVGQSILSGPKNDKAFAAAEVELSSRGIATHSVIADYPTFSSSGQPLRSATALFRDSNGEPYAALCFNADLTVIKLAHNWLEKMLNMSTDEETAESEPADMDVLMNEIISDAVNKVGKPPSMMNKEEKTLAVDMMFQRGLFIVKGSVESAARSLGVTRYTIYNYLDDCRRRNGTNVNIEKKRGRKQK